MATKNSPIRIRYVGGPGDVSSDHTNTIERLQRETFSRVYAKVAESHWWLAYRDGEPVAFAALHQYTNEPTTAFLALCGVAEDARGCGLQRRLIRVREQKAKALGVQRLISYTSADNVHSANNLIAAGYRLYVPRWEWGVAHANYFRKFV